MQSRESVGRERGTRESKGCNGSTYVQKSLNVSNLRIATATNNCAYRFG